MITLTDAKLHLRVDGTDEDLLIQSMIDASTVAAADYLNMPIADLLADIPTPVQAAILLQVGDLYANRERQSEKPYFGNATYERLLNPYRVMAM
ncbi:phage gp6-like head-tail connector protein [Pusillimonas sp. TS35]|nr:phage gp6-like head-tail connector protein [Pusillimonas sp. TS35]